MKFLTDLHEDKINLSGLTITAIELEFFKNFSNFLLFFKYIKFNLFENSLFMPNGEIAPDNHIKVDAINKLFQLN